MQQITYTLENVSTICPQKFSLGIAEKKNIRRKLANPGSLEDVCTCVYVLLSSTIHNLNSNISNTSILTLFFSFPMTNN